MSINAPGREPRHPSIEISKAPADHRRTGGSGRLTRLGAWVLAWSLIISGATAQASENLLVPGADLSELVLKTGAWCRYRVVDEALGQQDTTEVYVGIPAAESTPRGPAYWLEIASRPIGAAKEEEQVLKLLVLERITGFSEGDSLGDYVLKLYIKKGARPPEEKDPKTYEDLSLIVPTAEASWQSESGVPITTSGRRFVSTKKTRTVESNQEIPTGRVKLVRKSRDDYVVWFASGVPVFRLVKCVIERTRETQMKPRISGIPMEGEKFSRTTAELMDFGSDAKPILSVDDVKR